MKCYVVLLVCLQYILVFKSISIIMSCTSHMLVMIFYICDTFISCVLIYVLLFISVVSYGYGLNLGQNINLVPF